VSATAAGTGDATAVTGATIDRLDSNTGSLAGSAVVSFLFSTTLAATKTLSIGSVYVYQSSDASTWDSTAYYTQTSPGVVATGATGGSTVTGVSSFSVDLLLAKRYIRVVFTPDISATGTDTATIVAEVTLAGFDRLPS